MSLTVLRWPFGIAVSALLLVAATLATAPEVQAGSPVDIVILGGESAISASVAAELNTCTTGTVTRQAGLNRYQTAAAISKSAFTSASHAYIATGLNFPDALAGGPPAAIDGEPVLLVNDAVPASTAAELVRLGVSSITVLGGSAAVPDSVVASLNAVVPTSRISGSDRYATAAAVVQANFTSADTVYVATGLNFPDALAGVPAAAGDSAPILLVKPDSIPSATVAQLNRLKPSTIKILGGTAVISTGVANSLANYASNVIRLSGSDRYATATAISKHAFPSGASKIYIATGLNYPDALAGGPAAGFKDAPILLVRTDSVPDSTKVEIQRITGMTCGSTPPGVNEIDPEFTLLPDAGDVVFHTLDNAGTSTLTYDGKVDVGDVIVMGITPETPEGFLGRATRVSGDQVTTEPASLMDAIPVADFTAVVPVDPTHSFSTSSAGDADLFAAKSLVFSCGGQAVTVDVDPTFQSGSMIFKAKWGWTGLQKFEAGWRDLSISGDVTVTAAAGFGCTITQPIVKQPLPPMAFAIGVVPVVIVPTATIDLGFTAAASGGVAVGGDFEGGFGGGLIYEGGTWRSYTDPTYSGHAFSPVLTAGGSLTVDILAGLRGDIYGIGGPSVDMGPFVELAANTSVNPWWTIDGGLSVGMEISTNGWLIDLSYELLRIRLLTWRLAEATTDPPPDSWVGCGSQTSIPQSECDALVAIYDAMGGTGWSVRTGWLSDPDPCNWYDVLCRVGNGLSGHNVTDLFIDDVGATGPIPSEIANLTELWTLMIRRNPLVVGPIPPELGSTRNLRIMGFDGNSFAGTIPAWLGSMNLTQLWLDGNAFSGEVPVELMNLTNLNDDRFGLILNDQAGCLTAASAELSSWLTSYDPLWNDGCS